MQNHNSVKIAEILLVEDSPSHVLITKEALQEAKIINTLHVVEDGIAAMAFLRKQGMYASKPTPDLILLDLNLPRKDGREVLTEIKADPVLKTIPIIVLTTSASEEDIIHAYGLHANCYVVKPVEFEAFVKAVHSIEHFWFGVVTLPNNKESAL